MTEAPTETTPPSDVAPPVASPRRFAWLRRAWPYLFVACLALVASGLHIARNTELSPIDETRNLDYLVQIYEDGHFVKLGDKIGQTAMRLEACRGLEFKLNYKQPACSSRIFDPQDFRDDGYNNATAHPPGYHLSAGAFAKAATLLGLSTNLLDPARVFSGILLALGLMLTLFAGQLLGVSRIPLVAAATIFTVTPDVLNSASIVNPDAAGLLAGAVVLVAALLWERGRLSTWWLAVAGALAALFKMTNFIAIGIVVLVLLAQAYRQHRQTDAESDRPSTRRYLIACAALAGSAVAVTLIWIVIAGSRATVDPLALPSNQMFYYEKFPQNVLLQPENLFAFFPPGGLAYRALSLQTRVITLITYMTGWLSVAALLGTALRFSIKDRFSTLGGFSTIVLVVAAPAFMFLTFLANHVLFQPSPRYALSAIPIVIILLASMIKGRTATIVVSVYAAITTMIILGTLVFG